jgi:hypothetical protein
MAEVWDDASSAPRVAGESGADRLPREVDSISSALTTVASGVPRWWGWRWEGLRCGDGVHRPLCSHSYAGGYRLERTPQRLLNSNPSGEPGGACFRERGRPSGPSRRVITS